MKFLAQDILVEILKMKTQKRGFKFYFRNSKIKPKLPRTRTLKFIVVQDEKRKEELSKICNQQKHVKDCAALIIIISRLDFLDYFEENLEKEI